MIEKDSFILVFRDKKRRWIVRPADTPKLHTHLGILDCSSLVGKEYGIRVETSVGDQLIILRPTIEDLVMKLARRTQIIYPKDIALILFRCGIHSGSRVLEAGTGSGSATAAFAYSVMPGGMVYSYDINEEFQAVARKNLSKLGMDSCVTFKIGDAKSGFEERGVDAALIDLGDPWEVVDSVKTSLKPSGMMTAVTPTMNQAEKLVEAMKLRSFVDIQTVEIFLRYIEARLGMTRPSHSMVGHTAYLTFGRNST